MPFALVGLALAAVLGALCAADLTPDERMLASAGVIALLAFVTFGRFKLPQFRLALLAALVVSFASAEWHIWQLPHVTESRTARWSGMVLSSHAAGNLYETIISLDGGLRVTAALNRDTAIGAHVLVRGRLEPFDDARNPGETSERDRQAAKGIDARIASANIVAIERARSQAFQVRLAQAHAWALAQLRRYLGEPQASIVAGELWGERGDVDPAVRAEFQETGTVHVLVTAGLHVGLVSALVLLLCSTITLPRRVSCAIAIFAAWAFAVWSGCDLPALRAATMISVALTARAFGRATFSWNAIALACLVVSFAMPLSVATPSFWLSFTCVGSIFACAPLIEAWIERSITLPHVAREALVMTIATQLGVWPITAAVFLQFSWSGVIANLAVVPLVPATMLLGTTQLALAWCAPLAQAAANLNGWLLAWTLEVVHLLASLPITTAPMTPAPLWCIACYEAALLSLSPLLRRNLVPAAAALLVTATALVLWPPRVPTHDLRITMIDVGQADSILIQTPNGHAILVDGGGRLERGPQGGDSSAERVGEQIVVPFLLRSGIHELDAVILTHPHGDHVGGCAPVLRKIRVDEIADSGQVYGGHAYHDCLATASANRVRIVYPRAHDMWNTTDGVTLTFIGPSLPFIGGRNAINDNSVAFMLQYKHFRMFFTGDAGVAAERRFLDEGIDLHADVLKVGHHGSAYSSSVDFISAVHPRYALISVGRHNLFGHPAPSTVATLERIGARVYRTDENGAISVETTGERTTALPEMQYPYQR